jgi:uncharacterized protein YjbJ (UPF0337 family)
MNLVAFITDNVQGGTKMNSDILEGKWKQLKGKAQQAWGDLTNDDLDKINGNREELVGKVQERYGYARERAEEEVDRFGRENDLNW